jgi:hypothetical protein
MTYTSRAQDCAQRIKEAQIVVAKTELAYRKGGSPDALNRANAKLAAAHNDLYVASAGLVPDNR